MASDVVCAVVVTYHPGQDVVENLSALRAETNRIIVVDNGSSGTELAMLDAAAKNLDLEIIRNGENLGIATALNIGIRRAQQLACPWVLLFDQDSCVTPGFVEAMLTGFRTLSDHGPIGILVPQYRDKRLGNVMEALRESDGQIETAMTSGSLLQMSTLNQHGLLLDELFIDGVDHELSLRLRAAGFRLVECADALLLHSPGSPQSHRIIRKKPFQTSNYSAVRRYYQERNKVWLVRKYWREFPEFSRRQFSVTLKEGIKVVVLEQNKLEKMIAFLRGWWHGLRGHLGRRH